MIHEKRCHLKIARINLDVPVYKDAKTTEAIGREVEKRIKAIEKETDFIDTQKNAVIAAFNCLVELHSQAEEHDEDIQELTRALERLTSQMKSLEKRFHLDGIPHEEA